MLSLSTSKSTSRDFEVVVVDDGAHLHRSFCYLSGLELTEEGGIALSLNSHS